MFTSSRNGGHRAPHHRGVAHEHVGRASRVGSRVQCARDHAQSRDQRNRGEKPLRRPRCGPHCLTRAVHLQEPGEITKAGASRARYAMPEHRPARSSSRPVGGCGEHSFPAPRARIAMEEHGIDRELQLAAALFTHSELAPSRGEVYGHDDPPDGPPTYLETDTALLTRPSEIWPARWRGSRPTPARDDAAHCGRSGTP